MDANMPVLKERNCFTKKHFLDLLEFDAHIFQMTATMKFMDPSDEQVVKWAIHTLMTKGWHTTKSPQQVFIFTRDKNFKTTSAYKKLIKHHVDPNRRDLLDLVSIEIIEPEEGENRKKELFLAVAQRLNQHFHQLSPE